MGECALSSVHSRRWNNKRETACMQFMTDAWSNNQAHHLARRGLHNAASAWEAINLNTHARTLVEKWKIYLGNWCHPFVRKEEAIKRLGIYSRAENKGSRRDAKQESVRVADKKSPLSRSCVRSSACEMQHAFIICPSKGFAHSQQSSDRWMGWNNSTAVGTLLGLVFPANH